MYLIPRPKAPVLMIMPVEDAVTLYSRPRALVKQYNERLQSPFRMLVPRVSESPRTLVEPRLLCLLNRKGTLQQM